MFGVQRNIGHNFEVGRDNCALTMKKKRRKEVSNDDRICFIHFVNTFRQSQKIFFHLLNKFISNLQKIV